MVIFHSYATNYQRVSSLIIPTQLHLAPKVSQVIPKATALPAGRRCHTQVVETYRADGRPRNGGETKEITERNSHFFWKNAGSTINMLVKQ
jgi:hypothetical protein